MYTHAFVHCGISGALCQELVVSSGSLNTAIRFVILPRLCIPCISAFQE